jgi:hypothetical protein
LHTNTPSRRGPAATGSFSSPVPSRDRFARPDGRPQRTSPLTRNIEVAHLLPDLTSTFQTHRVPRSAIFERTAAAFARGTLLQGSDGPIAVEDLMPGDFIETSRGPQAVLWIGATALSSFGPGAEGSSLTHLTRILADTFGPGRPAADLVLGPAARLRHASEDRATEAAAEASSEGGPAGVLSPVEDFADGVGVFEVTPPGPVQLYHIAFRRHATFSAGGLEVESFHPGAGLGERLGPQGQALFLSLFGHLRSLDGFGPLALPRVSRDRPDDLTAA